MLLLNVKTAKSQQINSQVFVVREDYMSSNTQPGLFTEAESSVMNQILWGHFESIKSLKQNIPEKMESASFNVFYMIYKNYFYVFSGLPEFSPITLMDKLPIKKVPTFNGKELKLIESDENDEPQVWIYNMDDKTSSTYKIDDGRVDINLNFLLLFNVEVKNLKISQKE